MDLDIIIIYYHSLFKRHVLENPKWYTAYTPYQSEISQGRLECQYNFQSMVSSLTGLEIANSSLLDESSAAVEVMNMCYNIDKKNRKNFYVLKIYIPKLLVLYKQDLKYQILILNL